MENNKFENPESYLQNKPTKDTQHILWTKFGTGGFSELWVILIFGIIGGGFGTMFFFTLKSISLYIAIAVVAAIVAFTTISVL
ncbi:hypothetical protein Barb4_01288 [Bacteroidales bacterium Barb4]|nr:hypothetical protein Barb4_01288 [Bacteroidales bacterium Barb4]